VFLLIPVWPFLKRLSLRSGGFLVLAAFCVFPDLAGCRRQEGAQSAAGEDIPSVILWAWQRPEDLRFIDTGEIGVAPLVGVAVLSGDRALVYPRLNPLSLPEGAVVLPVVRIELDRTEPPSFSEEQRRALIENLWELLASDGGVSRLQVDFDAPLSARPWYRKLLEDLRQSMGPTAFLSMTALASWCMEDCWLGDLPVDEVVPMVFDMGLDGQAVRSFLKREGQFAELACRAAIGIAAREPLPRTPAVRRSYLFSRRPWTLEILETGTGGVQ